MSLEPKKLVKKLSRMKDFGDDRSHLIRLDRNERTEDYPAHIVAKILERVKPALLSMYPDQKPLYERLSKHLQLPADWLLLTPGSDAAIKAIYETYVNVGDKVVFLTPTYAMIEVYADLYGAEKVKIGYTPDLQLKYDELLAAIQPGVRLVVIANPNQPSGTILTAAQVDELVKKTLDAGAALVFDEAYQQFSGEPSAIRFVKDNAHVIVTQTFSKAFGLAGVRVGYLVSQPQNVAELLKVKSYADLNVLALKSAEVLLENYSEVENYVKETRDAQNWLVAEFKKLGLTPIPGHGNFMHIRMPEGAPLNELAAAIKAKGHVIRTTGVGLPAVLEGCVRITLGPVQQMKTFFELFKNEWAVLSAQKKSA